MKKIVIILFLVISSCAVFRSPEEQAKIDNEYLRMDNCVKTIKIVENANGYEITSIVSNTQRNGYDEYAVEALKWLACEKGGSAITFPERESGPIHTTYTSKVLIKK